MPVPALSIQNLSKRYGAFQALDGISFDVPPGDFLGFLGPNGAGKTTTINSITGLCNFQAGSVKVYGLDVVRDYRKTRPLIGLCPQEFNFDPFLTIEQLLIYQAGYFGVLKSEAAKRTRALLTRFRLIEKKNEYFRKLSGGMKRRLLLCRALVHDPKILILDEPTAGADVELKYHLWDFLKEMNAEGKTIFLTTHYMEEAEKLSKTIAILDKGKLISYGPKESLIKDRSLEETYLKIMKDQTEDE